SLSGYAAGFDARSLSAAQAEEVLDHASRIEKIAATLKSLAAGRLAETGSWRTEGDRSAAHQLARRTGTTVVQAASAIETARRLGALPETSAAARRGELSAEQAAAIADAAGADASAERELLETARRSPLAELRQQCARTKAAAHVDAEARRRRIHQRRSLRTFTDAEGEWHLHCRNNPEVGARIMAALDSFREAVFLQARAEGRHEPPEAYAADALTEMARCSREGGRSDRADDDRVDEASGAPGFDGVTEMSDAPGAAGRAERSRGKPTRRPAGPPKVIVRVDLRTLLRGYATEGEICEIAGFGPVAVSAVRDMIDSDDPFLTAVVTRGQELLGVAHLGRRPNALQQTALQWLYPSCANEACSAQARLDYDHRLDWASTHFTVLDLLDRLCSHCHALKTRHNWSLVEGRGKRALVPPDDPRHPGNAANPRQAPHGGPPRANAPPVR
ncbi:MAG TPA: DUF222 domain-containing protein, partial [Acidimicrobiales bacterium]|nr:DUF222 domain-containing protein [Acidimicrobiales bacterium]